MFHCRLMLKDEENQFDLTGLPQTFLNQKSRHGIHIDIIFPDYKGETDINFPHN